MKTYCGTDIIEIERIRESIEKTGQPFIDRIFTPNEIRYCESKNNVKYQHYAARFAAKEAIFKAISKALDDKFSIGWKNVEILNDSNGRPNIKFIDINIEGLNGIDISISHCKTYATATVVAEMD
ncbi:MAG: holo-ACP synthase [Clostridia bacterium]|nr:holo-ACP synthase [Clostridia bacterium]